MAYMAYMAHMAYMAYMAYGLYGPYGPYGPYGLYSLWPMADGRQPTTHGVYGRVYRRLFGHADREKGSRWDDSNGRRNLTEILE